MSKLSFKLAASVVNNSVFGEQSGSLDIYSPVSAEVPVNAGFQWADSDAYKLHALEKSNPMSPLKLQKLFKRKVLSHDSSIFSETEQSCGEVITKYATLAEVDGNLCFRNIKFCQSRYCPNCVYGYSRKKQQKIRFVLDSLLADETSDKYDMYFLTCTVPHQRWGSLGELLGSVALGGGIKSAYKKLTNSRLFRSDISGFISSLEVTYSELNGWHPHYHVLLFVRKGFDPDLLKERIFNHWRVAATSSGFGYLSSDSGIDLRLCGQSDTDSKLLACYLGKEDKWDLTSEMTSVAKVGRGNNLTMLQLQKMVARDIASPVQFMAAIEYIKIFKQKRVGTISFAGICKKVAALYDVKKKEDGSHLNVESKEVLKASMSWSLYKKIVDSNGLPEINRLYIEGFDLHRINTFISDTYDESFVTIFDNSELELATSGSRETNEEDG